jgi:hypothetical protein
MRWAGYVAHMGVITDANRILVGKPVVKKSLGRPRSRLEDNIKTDLKYSMRIHVVPDRVQQLALVNTVINL